MTNLPPPPVQTPFLDDRGFVSWPWLKWFQALQVAIPGSSLNAPLSIIGLPAYASNAAAIADGLRIGALYRTGADPDTVCVVH